MKKFTLINSIHLAGMSLIALAVIGGLTFGVSRNPSGSVLSETTASINMYVSYGSKTISEKPFTDKGFPNFDGGAAAFKIEISPTAPEGTSVTIATSDDCVLFSDGKGGGLYNQSKTDTINALYILAIGAVDDAEYEGDHTCKVTASFVSSSPDINGQQRFITFTIKDNEPKPESETVVEKTETPKVVPTEKPTAKPDVPITKFVDKDGNEVKTENSKAKFANGDQITVTGTTVANGEVKLYIYSEPQEASVVADDEGAWSYTLEKIEPGEHRVEVEVTDPTTGSTSERAEVLAFEVAQAVAEDVDETLETATTSQAENSSTGLLIAVGTSLLLLVVGIVGLIIYKKKHPHNEDSYKNEPINPSDGMGSDL